MYLIGDLEFIVIIPKLALCQGLNNFSSSTPLLDKEQSTLISVSFLWNISLVLSLNKSFILIMFYICSI